MHFGLIITLDKNISMILTPLFGPVKLPYILLQCLCQAWKVSASTKPVK